MPFTVIVSKTFQKDFQHLPNELQKLIRSGLKELQNDPYSARPHCDIKVLKNTKPKKHRLRVGEYRIIYTIEKNEVRVIYLMKREIGYG
ncbi:MAG: type II toxin-antitoxin system RelE/ParE family toxin [Candidatus Thermoplasmatota archaeon]|nr:type II toxin-antitoxin system RelE/ParE family toxin [Candidatus Thermoplasmatota archaeon]